MWPTRIRSRPPWWPSGKRLSVSSERKCHHFIEASESAEVSEESRELNDSNGGSVTQQGVGAHVRFMFVALWSSNQRACCCSAGALYVSYPSCSDLFFSAALCGSDSFKPESDAAFTAPLVPASCCCTGDSSREMVSFKNHPSQLLFISTLFKICGNVLSLVHRMQINSRRFERLAVMYGCRLVWWGNRKSQQEANGSTLGFETHHRRHLSDVSQCGGVIVAGVCRCVAPLQHKQRKHQAAETHTCLFLLRLQKSWAQRKRWII